MIRLTFNHNHNNNNNNNNNKYYLLGTQDVGYQFRPVNIR